MAIQRKLTKKINVGSIAIGGDAPVSIQSMTNTKTHDVQATVEQIHQLEQAGCDIVRSTVNTKQAAAALPEILSQISIPFVADIHYDYRLALQAIEAGVHKVRLNPGNIGNEQKIADVLTACKQNRVPIRIGVNSGSLEKDIMEKYGYPTADGMVESALRHIGICEKNNFDQIIISLKSSHTIMMIEAYRKLSAMVDYPLHLGVTEAGLSFSGSIKSAIGIGTLLAEGIGDTIRVSLTANPVEEIKVAREILQALEIQNTGISLVSCPTCGRVGVNLIEIANRVNTAIINIQKPLRVAVMGCVVNGPGEAADAHLGVACGNGFADLFVDGKKVRRIKDSEIEETLIDEIMKYSL